MNLGIAVVYLVGADDEKLLDLHLRQIEKFTDVPYTIYAAAPRLPSRLLSKLEHHPHVTIVDCVQTELRQAAEHSYYLEHLVCSAIGAGATHVVTLHVDSFPIRAGWAQALEQKLNASQPLAALSFGPYTACLFFCRDFYLNYKPRFLLSDNVRATAAYKKFSARHRHIAHSGIGYLFCADAAGLSWYPLTESASADAIGVVYEKSVFHLHGAARLAAASRRIPFRTRASPILRTGRGLVRRILPKPARQFLWERWGDQLSKLDAAVLIDTKQKMFGDPDAYFARLRLDGSEK